MKRLPIAVLATLGLFGCDDDTDPTDVGPCLSMQTDTDTESESDTESETSSRLHRDGARDRVLQRLVLPDDVAARLRGKA